MNTPIFEGVDHLVLAVGLEVESREHKRDHVFDQISMKALLGENEKNFTRASEKELCLIIWKRENILIYRRKIADEKLIDS